MPKRKLVIIPHGSEDDELSDEDVEWRPGPENSRRDPLYIPSSDDDSDQDNSEDSNTEMEVQLLASDEKSGRKKSKKTCTWVRGQRQYNEDNYAFLGDISLPDEIKSLNTPIQLYEYFFTSELVTHITTESNRYANDD